MAKQCYKTCVEFNCLAFEVCILAHWVASSKACVLLVRTDENYNKDASL
jgi:hypothetical protein